MATETTDRPDLAMPRSFDEDTPREGHELVPLRQGDTAIEMRSPVITAQKVALPRDLAAVQRRVRQHAALYGAEYIYSWSVKNNRSGGSGTVEGPTIKAAMMIAKQYGNCMVDTSVVDFGDHWLFKAWFCDLETGYSLTRNFLQRKNQNTGMKDADRQADIVFQIGQSKAIRNVVVNALPELTMDVIEASKQRLIDWLGSEENRNKANAYLDRIGEQFQISVARIEAVIGRVRAKWTVRDLAKAMTEMKGVEEGMERAEDVFPPLEPSGGTSTRGQDDKPTDAPAAKKAPAKKPAPKQEKKEPKPEPEPEDAAEKTPHDPDTGEVSEVEPEEEQDSSDEGDTEDENTADQMPSEEEPTEPPRKRGRPTNEEVARRAEEEARKVEMEGVPQFDLGDEGGPDNGDDIPEF